MTKCEYNNFSKPIRLNVQDLIGHFCWLELSLQSLINDEVRGGGGFEYLKVEKIYTLIGVYNNNNNTSTISFL